MRLLLPLVLFVSVASAQLPPGTNLACISDELKVAGIQ